MPFLAHHCAYFLIPMFIYVIDYSFYTTGLYLKCSMGTVFWDPLLKSSRPDHYTHIKQGEEINYDHILLSFKPDFQWANVNFPGNALKYIPPSNDIF